jgi:hypothetical protein
MGTGVEEGCPIPKATLPSSSFPFGSGRVSATVAAATLAVQIVIFAAPAAAQERTIGFVKNTAGNVLVIRGGQEQPASPGVALVAGDVLRTGADGRVGVTMKDETRLSLGPQTELTIAQFAYSPAERDLGFVMRLLRGTVAYISGRIAKLAPESIKIETPSSIVGIRGTHLLISAGQAGPP